MARALLVACLLAVAAAGAAADCSLPCSCAFGVEFGESVCGYANTTLDVAAVQVRTWGRPLPDLAGGRRTRAARTQDGGGGPGGGGCCRPRHPAAAATHPPEPPRRVRHRPRGTGDAGPAFAPRRLALRRHAVPCCPPHLPTPLQDLMSAAQPDFAAALKIYNNGSFAYGANGVTKRTM
jgi:hypothetical protein